MRHLSRILIFIIFILLFSNFSNAQYGFEKKYGSFGYEEGHSIINTNDGKFAVFGHTTSTANGDADGFILKIAQNGDSLWMKMYGSSKEEVIKYGIETSDKGFILCGYVDIDSFNRNILVIKTDSLGNQQWMKNYGGVEEDFANCIQFGIDSSYILTGKTQNLVNGNYDIFCFKINLDGDSIWFKNYGDSLNDIGRHIETTNDSGYILSGSSQNIFNAKYDMFLLKLNFFGDTIWTKRFHQRIDCFGYSAEQTFDGGYIFCGFHVDSADFLIQNIFVVKTDSIGNEQWRDTANWNFWSFEGSMLHAIKQTADSGFIAIGSDHLEVVCKNSNDSYQNLYIVKLNKSGNLVWENNFTSNNGLMEMGMDVAIVNDSTFVFCGYAETDAMSNTGNIYVIKTNKYGSSWNSLKENVKDNFNLKIFPNPVQNNLFLSFASEITQQKLFIKIIDEMGRIVYAKKFIDIQQNQIIELDLSESIRSTGVFHILIDGDNIKSTGNFVLIK